MSDEVARKDKICRGCFWWKHSEGKRVCRSSAARFTCRDWSAKHDEDGKENVKLCANCKFYGNFDECESKEPNHVCMSWESAKEKPVTLEQPKETKKNEIVKLKDSEVIPDKYEIRRMLNAGTSPLEISEKLGITLTTMETPIHVDDAQLKILKHHLNTVFSVLPAVELRAKADPGQSNIASLTSLIATSRDILDDINNRQDPGDQYARMVSEIIEPMTTKFLEVMTKNSHKLLNDLRPLVTEGKNGIYEKIFKDSTHSLTSEMQSALELFLKKLQEMIGV